MSTAINHSVDNRSGILVIEREQPKEPDTKALEQQANVEVERATQATVESEADYDRECLEMVRLKSLIEAARESFDPIVERTNAAHKEACNRRNIVISPLERAKTILGQKVGAFLTKLKLAREAEERRQIEEARRQAEEQREAEIEQAETFGAAPEEVQALCDRALDVMPVVRSYAAPSGPVSARDNYKGQVTDKLLLVRYVAAHPEHLNLLVANETAINQLAKALKTAMRIPGIQVINQVGTSTRTAPPASAQARGGR